MKEQNVFTCQEELEKLKANRTAKGDILSDHPDLLTEQYDDLGRRRYTLCSIRGEPAMIPDKRGFWTPADDTANAPLERLREKENV